MSDMTTIARPYAKAIFEHALAGKQLAAWSVLLHDLSQAVLQPDARRFIDNPATSASQQSKLLFSVLAQQGTRGELKPMENLIELLAQNKRLPLLPDISAQFDALRSEQEKTLTVAVHSFSTLTQAQQQQLIDSLSQRLQRRISLDVIIDKSLLGGAIIRAGDLIIDGSVRGKLNKLGTDLAA